MAMEHNTSPKKQSDHDSSVAPATPSASPNVGPAVVEGDVVEIVRENTVLNFPPAISAPSLSWPLAFLAGSFMVASSIFYLAFRMGPASPSAPDLGNLDDAGLSANLPAIGDRDVILGDPNAPVALIEYGDYQCPFCGRFFTESQPQIVKDYVQTGKVKMVYRDIAFLGPDSKVAAQAAECAKDQGKFWPYHNALYSAEIADGVEHNGNLDRTLFLKLANDLKLNTSDFAQCFDEKKYEAYVAQQSKAAGAVGVNSTPTVFINGRQVVGAQPYIDFQEIIEEELAKKS